MLESTVWGHFYTAWPYHSERQEPALGSGQPDVLLQDKIGAAGLIELKRPDKVELNNNQWIWHEQWASPNGRSLVVTCLNHQGRIRWQAFRILFDPRRLELFKSHLMDKVEMVETVAKHLRLKL